MSFRDITANGALMLGGTCLSLFVTKRTNKLKHDPRLAPAHESQPDVEGAPLAPGIRQEVRRIDIVIHYVRIAGVGEVIQSESPGPEVVQEGKAALEMEIDVEVGGQASSIRVADQEP